MHDGISVTSRDLLALVDNAHAAVAQIDETLRDLDDRVAALRANWTGEAAEAYDTAQREWRATAQQMRDALDTSRAGLLNAHEHYGAAHDSAVRTWS